jgi:hypothetical protein
MGRRKTFAVLAVCGGIAATIWLATGRAAGPASRGSAAPPASAGLAASAPLQAMAKRSGIDPAQLSEVVRSDRPLGTLVAGRDRSGRTCVAEATPSVAGSFACNPFAKTPLYLVAGARGTPSNVTWSGFLAVVDRSVARVAVRVVDGSLRDVAINPAGGLAYGGSTAASFPTEVIAYGADGRTLMTMPLPYASPPSR